MKMPKFKVEVIRHIEMLEEIEVEAADREDAYAKVYAWINQDAIRFDNCYQDVSHEVQVVDEWEPVK